MAYLATAVSVLTDYNFTRRFDAYVGVMVMHYSGVGIDHHAQSMRIPATICTASDCVSSSSFSERLTRTLSVREIRYAVMRRADSVAINLQGFDWPSGDVVNKHIRKFACGVSYLSQRTAAVCELGWTWL